MPEGVEIYAFARLISRFCLNRRIKTVKVVEDPVVLGENFARYPSLLQGQKVTGVGRKGKLFWMELMSVVNSRKKVPDLPCRITFHAGMTGGIIVRGEEPFSFQSFKSESHQWPPRFWKLELEMDDGCHIAFTDARRFGRVCLLFTKEDIDNSIGSLGLDPLAQPYFTVEQLGAAIGIPRGRTVAIKTALLQQNGVSGIGNWIADEVLWHSKIHPETPVAAIDFSSLQRLHQQIKYVFETGCSADADSSKFPHNWIFHVRWLQGKQRKGVKIEGKTVSFITVGGRSTAFVPSVQKLRRRLLEAEMKTESKRRKNQGLQP